MPGKKGLFKLKKSASAPNISLEWSKHDEKLLHEVEQAHKEKVETLINKKGLNPTKVSPQGRTAFHEAVTRGQKGILEIFIKHGADVHAADAQGRTALHLAARHGRTEVLLKLIKAGISVCAMDLCQMMPIHHACLGGHLPCVNTLLSKESPLNPEDKDKRTPLFFAAEMGEGAVCRELIDKGVNLNAQDFGQRTALMVAAQNGHAEVVDLFVKRGVNVKLMDDQGRTAAWYALEAGHPDVKTILDEAPVMAAWDVCAPEEPVQEEQTNKTDEVKQDSNVLQPLPDSVERFIDTDSVSFTTEMVDFIAQFTVDDSPSPATSKRSQPVPNLFGEVVVTDEENNTPSSHESYLEIARKPKSDATSEDTAELAKLTKAYQELIEDSEAMAEEHNNVKREMKKVKNKNTELQRHLESRSPPPTSVNTAIVEALEKEISDLQKQLQRSKSTKLVDAGEKNKQNHDDSWNDTDDEVDFSGSFDKPASLTESTTDKQLIPMLRSQILTLQKENDSLKRKIKKIPNGDFEASSDEEGPGVSKLDVNILNGDAVTSFSYQDIAALNERIQELEKANGEQLRKIIELQESNNNDTGVNFGAEISGVAVSVDEGLKMEELKIKVESLTDLNEALKNTTDELRGQNDQLLVDVGHLKVELDDTDSERETFKKQLQEIASFGNSDDGTDVLKFFQEVNGLKREHGELMMRNDQLEEEIEQLLKQRTADHKVPGVLPDESVGPQENIVEEVIFGVQAGNVESSGVALDESPYESQWAAGARTQNINSLQQDNEVLQLKVKELTDQKMELETNAEDMYETISRYEEYLGELKNMNGQVKEECDSLKKHCGDLELESKRYRLEVSGLKKSVEEGERLEDENDKLQDNHEAVTFVLDETKRHVEILAKENEDLKVKVTAMEMENVSTCESLRSEAADESEKLNNQVHILKKEKETYQEQLDELNNSLRKKNNRISSLVQTIEELKRGSSMLSSSKNDIEDQMGSMRREIETLKYENEELEKTVQRLMKRGSEEESIKLSIAKSTSPLPSDDTTVLQLEKEVERLNKKVKKLQEENKEYSEEMEEFAETNQCNFDQCTQLCDELGTLKEEYKELDEEKTNLEEHLRQSEEEQQRLHEQISIKKRSIKELRKQCEEISVRNEELSSVVSNLKEECLQLEVDKDKLAQELHSLRGNQEVPLVSADVNLSLAAAPEIDSALLESGGGEDQDEEEVHQLREECSDLVRMNSELKVRAQSVTQVQEELFELQEENDRLIGEVEKATKKVAALMSENRSLQDKCEGLENGPVSGSGTSEEWEVEKTELQKDVQNLQDKMVILSHEMSILMKSNAKLSGECEGYVSQVQSLEDERDAIVNEKETILKLNATLRCQLEDLERENIELEKDRVNESDLDKLKEKDRVNVSDLDKLKENLSALDEEKSSLQEQVKDLKHLETESVQLKIDISELKSGRLKMEEKRKALLVQNEDLRGEVLKLSQIANSRIPPEQTSEQVKQAVQDAERKIKKLHDEIRRLKKHNKDQDLRHREVVATYRTHLLSAVQGNMTDDVREALDTIQELRKT